jgi:hypothetical protein
VANTLNQNFNASGRNTPCVAFHQNQRGEVTLNDTAGSLKVGGGKPGQGYPAVAIGWSEELTASKELAGTLQYGGQGGRHDGVMTPAMQVRRLTPVECERLQGFPDGYTAIPWRNKPAEDCPDGPRYKALGNSMAVPCMRWIGNRIRMLSLCCTNLQGHAVFTYGGGGFRRRVVLSIFSASPRLPGVRPPGIRLVLAPRYSARPSSNSRFPGRAAVRKGMKFYLGLHQPADAELTRHPVFMSCMRLMDRKKPLVHDDWIMDSGGFTMISKHGAYTVTERRYLECIRRHSPKMAFCQDWMCEPFILKKTGLAIAGAPTENASELYVPAGERRAHTPGAPGVVARRLLPPLGNVFQSGGRAEPAFRCRDYMQQKRGPSRNLGSDDGA